MVRRRVVPSARAVKQKFGFAVFAAFALLALAGVSGSGLQPPEQFLGHKIGADNKLVRWDKAVDYFKLAAASTDRVRYRELGKTSNGNPFIVLEISSADTLKNLDRYKQLEIDAQHPLGYGVAPETYGFYVNSPFFAIVEGFASQRTTVVARYPNTNVVASGWLKGEELMTGRAAVVSIDMNPGKVVLFGLRPQHRAQTHATFPLLFNALYLSALGDGTKTSN